MLRPTAQRFSTHSPGISVGLATAVVLLAMLPSAHGAFRLIDPRGVSSPAVGTGRHLPITQVVFTNPDNSTITQNSSQPTSPIVGTRTLPLFLSSVTVDYSTTATPDLRELTFFNDFGAEIRNFNVTTAQTGIGVISHNGSGFVNTNAGSDLPGFQAQLIASTQNNDITNYIYYDGPSAGTTVSGPDFDILFTKGLEVNDAVLIQERNGNTFFTLQPIGADGNVIADANTLVFGSINGDAAPVVADANGDTNTRYDWNTGFGVGANTTSAVGNQPMAFTVASVEQFFVGTTVSLIDQIVYGFRIDNNGNADVKFFPLSEDTFENNPNNPQIPEPAAAGLFGGLLVILAAYRRR